MVGVSTSAEQEQGAHCFIPLPLPPLLELPLLLLNELC